VIQKEIDDLKEHNATLTAELAALKAQGPVAGANDEKMRTLKKELEETIEEYEHMTKASIEWEKEREQLESTIDKLRDERENLEAQLSDERVRWLGMKSPGVDGAAQPGATSTTVLKNEFKKMMRDTRAENAKALRVCFNHLFPQIRMKLISHRLNKRRDGG
jgi:DNA repair exonuclease SbcCD ATPase subunit